MSEPVRHHLVSQGYQANFANAEKRLAIVRVADGSSPKLRAVRNNWWEPNFNTIVGENDEQVNHLEAEFSKVEARALSTIRQIGPDRCGPDERAAVVELFAMHLVRSLAMREAQRRLYTENIDELLADVDDDPKARARFHTEYGRQPRSGELAAIAREIADDRSHRNVWRVESMISSYNSVGAILAKYPVQVVEIASPEIGSFVLGDVPVVHAHRESKRFGFRDGLAVGDADFVGAPLTRRTAVLFTATPLPHHRLTTKAALRNLNFTFIRAARVEVACHPAEKLPVQRLCRHRPYPDLPIP